MDIVWTSSKVKNLGAYFGNDEPDRATFGDIIPNITRRLNYWKQFQLSQIGKARVVEIFLLSKLIFATSCYHTAV